MALCASLRDKHYAICMYRFHYKGSAVASDSAGGSSADSTWRT